MTGIRKNLAVLLFGLSAAVVFTGCGGESEEKENAYTVYELNNAETGFIVQDYRMQAPQDDITGQIDELLEQLTVLPEKLEYKPPLCGSVSLTSYYMEEDQLTLDFDERYRELPTTTEILLRAAIVRTLTQIDGVSYVKFVVRGEPLVDNLGNVVGMMSADLFIDNAGDEINSYEQAQLQLYFADESGTRLVGVNRTLRFSSNIAKEKLVVEQLIQGPQNDGFYPTVNPETKVVNVTVKDGICYVNLSENFLTQTNPVTPEIAVYSMVNSLVELPNINKVQISVNGETDVTYQETISLSNIFERNLDLLFSEEE